MAGYHTYSRLYIDDTLAQNALLTLEANQSHYLCQVMRLKPSQNIRVFNGRDGEWLASISDAHRKHTVIEIQKNIRTQSAEPDIWLCIAPVKNAATPFILQKATELGIRHFCPIRTERTIITKINHEKLSAQAIEAAEQCERLTIPGIAPLTPLITFLQDFPSDRTLIFCDESGNGKPAAAIIPQLTSKKYAVIIGPEGGFTTQEREHIASLPNAHAITLGPRILRADTACITALSCLMMHQADWNKAPEFRT